MPLVKRDAVAVDDDATEDASVDVSRAVVAAAGFTLAGEWLRIVEEPAAIFGFTIPGIPGMRMVILSLALLLVIIFCRRGLWGRREFSLDLLERPLKQWRP